MQSTSTFDLSRASLGAPDRFKRFLPGDRSKPLARTGLAPDTLLIVFERKAERRALLVSDMIYHHLAQGELAGEPWAISF